MIGPVIGGRANHVTVHINPTIPTQGVLGFPTYVVALGRTADGWYQVAYNGYNGWVQDNRNIRTEAGCPDTLPFISPADYPGVPTPAQQDGCWVHVFFADSPNNDGILLYDGVEGTVIGVVPLRTEAPVLAYGQLAGRRRFQISLPGGEIGWIDADTVMTNGHCQNLPVSTS